MCIECTWLNICDVLMCGVKRIIEASKVLNPTINPIGARSPKTPSTYIVSTRRLKYVLHAYMEPSGKPLKL